jgi:hypothetical protein
MAKVINKTITTHLTNMKDGDVAEIVNWFCDEEMEPGTIVQRYGDALIIIGGRSGLCYPKLLRIRVVCLLVRSQFCLLAQL